MCLDMRRIEGSVDVIMASGGRDGVIHIYSIRHGQHEGEPFADVEVIQTLSDHSAAVMSVKVLLYFVSSKLGWALFMFINM